MTDDTLGESGFPLPTDDGIEPGDPGMVLVDRELMVALRRRARGLDRLLDRLLATPDLEIDRAAMGHAS